MPAQMALPIGNLNAGPLPEATLLDNVAAPGFFSLLVRATSDEYHQDHKKRSLRQRSYCLDQMPYVLDHVDPSRDSYLSQGEFFRPNRRVVNLWRIGVCFVDLDVYRTEAGDHSPEFLVDMVRFHCEAENTPRPSLIVWSGRGLYLKWVLERPLPQAALPRWIAVQRELVRRFAAFGADPKAVPASQVLRLVQTVNTKSGERVRVLYQSDGLCLYRFDDLADHVLPFTRQQIRDFREGRALAKESGGQLRLIPGGRQGPARFSARTLAWHRLLDMRTLQRLRGGVIEEGQRELNLFWRLLFLLASGITTPQQMFHRSARVGPRDQPRLR